MSGKGQTSERPTEQEAVRTTIVGGRPPGSGKRVGEIPRGVEVLVKKASVDPGFCRLLLERRADAAKEIGLSLTPPEVAMINAVPRDQLEAIIDRTEVGVESRAAFLGRAAAVMLAALGAGSTGCERSAATGERPDRPEPGQTEPAATQGVRPDRPKPTPTPEPTPRPTQPPPPTGIRPDPPPTRGVRPDRP